jgi:hypothetical protein
MALTLKSWFDIGQSRLKNNIINYTFLCLMF